MPPPVRDRTCTSTTTLSSRDRTPNVARTRVGEPSRRMAPGGGERGFRHTRFPNPFVRAARWPSAPRWREPSHTVSTMEQAFGAASAKGTGVGCEHRKADARPGVGPFTTRTLPGGAHVRLACWTPAGEGRQQYRSTPEADCHGRTDSMSASDRCLVGAPNAWARRVASRPTETPGPRAGYRASDVWRGHPSWFRLACRTNTTTPKRTHPWSPQWDSTVRGHAARRSSAEKGVVGGRTGSIGGAPRPT